MRAVAVAHQLLLGRRQARSQRVDAVVDDDADPGRKLGEADDVVDEPDDHLRLRVGLLEVLDPVDVAGLHQQLVERPGPMRPAEVAAEVRRGLGPGEDRRGLVAGGVAEEGTAGLVTVRDRRQHVDELLAGEVDAVVLRRVDVAGPAAVEVGGVAPTAAW